MKLLRYIQIAISIPKNNFDIGNGADDDIDNPENNETLKEQKLNDITELNGVLDTIEIENTNFICNSDSSNPQNGKIVTQLGTKVDPDKDIVEINEQQISSIKADYIYIMLNK